MSTNVVRTYSNYERSTILRNLRDASAGIEASLKTFDEQLQAWKAGLHESLDKAVEKFEAAIARHGPANVNFYFDTKTPSINGACQDWRIKQVNEQIIRFEAMADDVVKLRSDDPVFGCMALAACL